MSKLKKLSDKIEKFKDNNKSIQFHHDTNKKASFNYSIAINISIELITGIGLGVFFATSFCGKPQKR